MSRQLKVFIDVQAVKNVYNCADLKVFMEVQTVKSIYRCAKS